MNLMVIILICPAAHAHASTAPKITFLEEEESFYNIMIITIMI